MKPVNTNKASKRGEDRGGMNQIARQGKDMLEVIQKYEVPQEFHSALWAAYEAGAEMGFWKAIEATPTKLKAKETQL
jgi:hypothetical protein